MEAHRYIYHLDPICIPHQVVGEHGGTLQACVGPFLPVGVCDVEPGDSYGLNLVGLLGDDSLDGLLVLLAQDGGHSYRGRGELGQAHWSISTGE